MLIASMQSFPELLIFSPIMENGEIWVIIQRGAAPSPRFVKEAGRLRAFEQAHRAYGLLLGQALAVLLWQHLVSRQGCGGLGIERGEFEQHSAGAAEPCVIGLH